MNLLNEAIIEAERFLRSAQNCKTCSDNFITGCQYRADTKRKSMDLTRALSALRKPDISQWKRLNYKWKMILKERWNSLRTALNTHFQ